MRRNLIGLLAATAGLAAVAMAASPQVSEPQRQATPRRKTKAEKKAEKRARRNAGVKEYTEGRDPQHVLKAEAARPDATGRGNRANASPGGGPMGVGQAAAAAPAGVMAAETQQEKKHG